MKETTRLSYRIRGTYEREPQPTDPSPSNVFFESSSLFPVSNEARINRLLGVSVFSETSVVLDAPRLLKDLRKSGIETQNMDPHVSPRDNFFRYANGNWLKKAVIPEYRREHSTTSITVDNVDQQLREIVENLRRKPQAKLTDEERKIVELYASYMDLEQIEQRGLAFFKKYVAEIDALSSKRDVAAWYGKAAKLGVESPVTFGFDVDQNNPQRHIFSVGFGGLGLPNREAYSNSDAQGTKLKEEYRGHIAKMFRLIGESAPAHKANAVYAFETLLSKKNHREKQKEKVDEHLMSIDELGQLTPSFDWRAYFGGLGLSFDRKAEVDDRDDYKNFGEVFDRVSLENLKTHAKWQLLRRFARYLPEKIEAENFRFTYTVLKRTAVPYPRWRRGISLVGELLPGALGAQYVQKHFSKDIEQKVRAMFEEARSEFIKTFESTKGLSANQRQFLIEKAKNIHLELGGPGQPRSYEQLRIVPDDLFGNVVRASEFKFQQQVRLLKEPVQKEAWSVAPFEVNAFFTRRKNRVTIPAGILQSPLFNPDADDAFNYGITGYTLAHEIGHAFDSHGVKRDEIDKRRNISEDDLKTFDLAANKLVAQYDAYELLPGLFGNGSQVQRETISDVMGLVMAFRAYKASLKGRPAPVIDGLTGEQRFFLAYAQSYATAYRPDYLREHAKSSTHPSAEFRTNLVRNLPEFCDAFGLRDGSPMCLKTEEQGKLW